MSEDSVIFLAEIKSSQVDNKSAVEAAVSPSPVVVVPEKNAAGEMRGESCGESRGTKWSRRCVRDRGGQIGWYGGRRWGRWCCWWRGRVWGLWIRVWVIHGLRDPVSKKTGEECVRGCRWHRSPSTMWVFKSSSLTLSVAIRISLLASRWILLG